MKILPLSLLYAAGFSLILARRGFRAGAAPTVPETGKPPERILIVGATGGTGRELVRQALERGYSVTAFVRNPARLPIQHPQLTVKQGDVLDYASVEAAVRDQDAVVSALGHKRFFYPNRIQSDGISNILRAMKAHGVRHLICETALGLGDSVGRLGPVATLFVVPVILPFYFWDKARQEQLIAASDREWVIVRPATLNNKPARGSYRHGPEAGSFWGVPRISRADVADFMLEQLTSNTYLGRAPGLSW